MASSAGEALNPEATRWFAAELGVTIHDQYGQTELGMFVNNHYGLDHKVHIGSAGLAMAGFRALVVDAEGKELPSNVPGELAVDTKQSPLFWFGGCDKQPTPSIANGLYRTGDVVERGIEGAISFVGRNDDVITSADYRIGSVDVESALLEHPAVV